MPRSSRAQTSGSIDQEFAINRWSQVLWRDASGELPQTLPPGTKLKQQPAPVISRILIVGQDPFP